LELELERRGSRRMTQESKLTPKAQRPSIAIILLNWNNYRFTEECLKSLSEVEHKNFDYKVVVVDNGSPQWEVEELRKRIGVDIHHLIEHSKNLGYVVATNKAVRYALDEGFDYTLQLDNDAIVDKECVDKLVEVAEADDKVGIVGAKIFYYDQPDRLQWTGEEMNLWTGDIVGLSSGITRIIGKRKRDAGDTTVREIGCVVSWCALTKRKVWEKIGLLDEYLFFGWEDDDFSMRAHKAGFKLLYNPNAKVWHRYASAFALDGLLQYYGPKTRFRFMRKHASFPQLITFHLFFFGVHFWLATAYYLLWVRKPKIWPKFLKGVWEGVRGKD